ncbi:unnamed protein product [Didymodactylos carnosus]|uniref:Uncharacterized protein n=1 Tax=Didymodactylos carnosus TaxID=1234261 RepID=A0A814QG70_9BILA|nr:unnamed protein product [Didymodactylos carnosus]CAF3883846.1 unnamed protein product [Didymodactylos carnosus]
MMAIEAQRQFVTGLNDLVLPNQSEFGSLVKDSTTSCNSGSICIAGEHLKQLVATGLNDLVLPNQEKFGSLVKDSTTSCNSGSICIANEQIEKLAAAAFIVSRSNEQSTSAFDLMHQYGCLA